MKKIKYTLFALTIIFISGSAAFNIGVVNAQKTALLTADPFPAERPGQYVYYHDMRKGVFGIKEPVDRLIGLMKVENKQYVIHVCSIKEGKSYLFLGRFILKNGIMEFYTESTMGDLKEGAIILSDLLNLLEYLGVETIKNSAKLKNRNDLIVNSTWKSYNRKLINSYKWWIPFYKLEASRNSETDSSGEKGAASLKLVCFGTVAPDDPDMFARIRKIPVSYKDKTPDKKYKISEAEKKNVKLDNISLKLDKNWHFEKGDPSRNLYDSYCLKKFTARDAQIGVETIESTNIKVEKNLIES